MWYFTDDTLQLSQQYEFIEARQARIDVGESYRRQADANIANEALAYVRKERPDWKAHCLLVAPWKELKPTSYDDLNPARLRRYRRHVFVYQFIEAERVQMVYQMQPLMLKTGDMIHTATTLVSRPVRGVADDRSLMGALWEGTLYILER